MKEQPVKNLPLTVEQSRSYVGLTIGPAGCRVELWLTPKEAFDLAASLMEWAKMAKNAEAGAEQP